MGSYESEHPEFVFIKEPKAFRSAWDDEDSPEHDPLKADVHSKEWMRWVGRRFVEQGRPCTITLESGRPYNCTPCYGPDAVEQYAAQIETETAIDKITGVHYGIA